MFVIFGGIVVLVAVLVGFSMAGGHVGTLLHLSEFVTIIGSSLGALIVMSPKRVLRDVVRSMLQVIKGTPYNKQAYFELFGLFGEMARTARRDGILALESHILDPQNSSLFSKYPRISKNKHALSFLCEGFSLLLEGITDANQLAGEIDKEIQVVEREHHEAISVLHKTADALPGFGIVAAVLGIVVTMQAIDGPASQIGYKVGAALVGTFLGILLSYGFFAPMAARLEFISDAELTFFRTISQALVSLTGGENPRGLINRARRLVATECRPSLLEMEQIVKEGAHS